MYHQYFGLKEAPFSIAPNPRYLFMSRRHKEALAHLIYGVSHGGGFVLLTGEVGTGKTTISRCLLRQLPKNTDVAYILNPYLNSTELLASICDELKVDGVKDTSSLKDLSDQLHAFLLKNHSQGRNTVLIIDEAQHLGYQVMEQIRLLTNLETDEKKLLQIIFIGQPELNEILAKPELRQLAQRITARFHIDPLTLAETKAYIRHRMMIAGLPANRSIFTPTAVKIIFQACQGIPRLINVTCDRALLGTYTHGLNQVDKEIAQSAVEEATGKKSGSALNNSRLAIATASVLSLTVLVLTFWLGYQYLHLEPNPLTEDTNTGEIQRTPAINAETGAIPTSTSQQDTQTASTSAEPDSRPAPPAQILPDIKTLGYLNKAQALNELQRNLNVFAGDLNPVCDRLGNYGVQCRDENATSWLEFKSYNRPSVLELLIEHTSYYLAVAEFSDNQLIVVSNAQRYPLSPFELGQYWTGKFTLLWQPPQGFEALAKLGDKSNYVNWIAQSFAVIDQRAEALTDYTFTKPLETRVAVFQGDNNLEPDGIVGLRTVLKMNDYLNNDFSLDSNLQGRN